MYSVNLTVLLFDTCISRHLHQTIHLAITFTVRRRGAVGRVARHCSSYYYTNPLHQWIHRGQVVRAPIVLCLQQAQARRLVHALLLYLTIVCQHPVPTGGRWVGDPGYDPPAGS